MLFVVFLGIFDIVASLVFFFNFKAVALLFSVVLFLKAIYTFASGGIFDPLGALDFFASIVLISLYFGINFGLFSFVMAILFLKGLYSIISL